MANSLVFISTHQTHIFQLPRDHHGKEDETKQNQATTFPGVNCITAKEEKLKSMFCENQLLDERFAYSTKYWLLPSL